MPTLNHNIFNRRNLVIAGIIILACFLAWVIFRGRASVPSHKDDAKEVQALQERLKQTEQKAAEDSARFVQRDDSLKAVNHDLLNKKDVVEKELAKLRKDVKRVSNKLDTARAKKDTLGYIAACDSLQERTIVQDQVIAIYEAYVDSVGNNYEAQILSKDSLLANRAHLITELRRANTETNEKYQSLYIDYKKTTKKLKRERTLSRVLAAGAAVLGGMILLK